jgi:hypothetical protein
LKLDVERPASPDETPEVAENEPDRKDDGFGKGIDVERRLQMIALVEEVEERLVDQNTAKWNAILKAKVEELDQLREDFKEDWEAFEGKKKAGDLTDLQRKDFANRRAKFTRDHDVLDQAIYDANKAKKKEYACIHDEAIRLIRKIKAGKYENLTDSDVKAILLPGK